MEQGKKKLFVSRRPKGRPDTTGPEKIFKKTLSSDTKMKAKMIGKFGKKNPENLPVLKKINDQREACKCCKLPFIRFFIAEKASQGVGPTQLSILLKKTYNFTASHQIIKRHIEECEGPIAPWVGMVSHSFPSEDQRKKFETAFLSRISLVLEMWKPYETIKRLFEEVVGTPDYLNPTTKDSWGVERASRLSAELRAYLDGMLKLQKERDLIIEVSKVVLFTMANKLVERLGMAIVDLPIERKEMIAKIIQEETKASLEYAKSFGKEKVDHLLSKVKADYEKLKEQ